MSLQQPTPPDLKKKKMPVSRPVIKVRLDPLKGRIALGRYRINARLATGGMSMVYLARDVHEGGLFAVKILRGDLVFEKGIRERFVNESLAAQRINHPSVVKIYDVGAFDDMRVCLVMEYVHGGSLRKVIERGPISPAETVTYATAIAEGLDAAHRQGVIHRDLKPENVLLPQDEESQTLVKLVDFGIARIVDTPHITTTQHIMGTPQYISPEQAMGGQVDQRSDIYSLGVLMYEMLTGDLPFSSPAPEKLLHQHISDPPLSLHDRTGGFEVPEQLEALVMRCLAKAPWNRPQNMTEVLAALVDLLKLFTP